MSEAGEGQECDQEDPPKYVALVVAFSGVNIQVNQLTKKAIGGDIKPLISKQTKAPARNRQ